MRRAILYIFLLLAPILAGCPQKKKVILPSLDETYEIEDYRPFGGLVAYNRIKHLLDDRFIQTQEDAFDVSWKTMKEYSSNTKYSLYILLAKNVIANDNEVDALIDFAESGNDLLIAADYIDDKFLKKITVTPERDSEMVEELAGNMRLTNIHINSNIPRPYTPNFSGSPDTYSYYFYPFLNAFSGFDDRYTKVLGYNEAHKPNCIVHFIGKGRIYLVTAQRAFSNYFLLKNDNYKYIDNIVSYLRPDPKNIFWDQYYNKQDVHRKHDTSKSGNSSNDFSSFNVINKHPALKTAFWLAVVLILLYVLFNMKRKQRIIKDIKPNINTSLVFTETVGRLYLQKKNNKNIAEKMITYFFEHIRNNYFLNTTKIDKEFISSLSRKSGMEHDATERLFNTIKLIQQQLDVDDISLLSLNEQVQKFIKIKTNGRANI